MKKALKIFGLALLAGAVMFTACKKDEEDTTKKTNNTENNGGNNGGENNNDADTLPTIGAMLGSERIALGYYEGFLDDEEMPYMFAVEFTGYVDGHVAYPDLKVFFNFDNTDNKGYYMTSCYYTSSADRKVTIGEERWDEWVGQSGSLAVSKFEASPVRVSFDAEVIMKSYYEEHVNNVTDESVLFDTLFVSAHNLKFSNKSFRNL